MISQVGITFSSLSLVAEYVLVVLKHNNNQQYIWKPIVGGILAITPETTNNLFISSCTWRRRSRIW
jgi:hypothetical protein